MSNIFKNTQLAVSNTIASLVDSSMFIGTLDKQYDSKFANKSAQIGNSIDIKKPFVPTTALGRVATAQDYVETYTTLTLSSQRHALIPFTSVEETLNLEEFRKAVAEPVGFQMSSDIEEDAYDALMPSIGNLVIATGDAGGGVGTGLKNIDVINAGVKLTRGTTPTANRMLLVDPADEGFYINENRNQFNNQAEISKQYVDSYVGHANGFMWGRSNRLPTITTPTDMAGTLSATYVSGATTMAVAGLGANEVIQAGQVFTVAGVNAVGPQTKRNLGYLFQFSVRETVTLSGTGTGTLTIEPAWGPLALGLQNLSAIPTSGAVVTLAGTANTTYRQSITYVKQAFTMGTADLALPTGGAVGARDNMDGVSGRLIRGWDVAEDKDLPRFDVLYGFRCLRPEYACKIWVKQ